MPLSCVMFNWSTSLVLIMLPFSLEVEFKTSLSCLCFWEGQQSSIIFHLTAYPDLNSGTITISGFLKPNILCAFSSLAGSGFQTLQHLGFSSRFFSLLSFPPRQEANFANFPWRESPIPPIHVGFFRFVSSLKTLSLYFFRFLQALPPPRACFISFNVPLTF